MATNIEVHRTARVISIDLDLATSTRRSTSSQIPSTATRLWPYAEFGIRSRIART